MPPTARRSLSPPGSRGAFLQQIGTLDQAARQALVLSAASETGDLPTLERAAAASSASTCRRSAAAEAPGWSSLHAGTLEFRHPLARSAIYADAPASERRAAHRALAAALPDRDIRGAPGISQQRRSGTDETASAALEQAGIAGRERSAYATAAAAFERAARLAAQAASGGPGCFGCRQRLAGWPGSPTAPSPCSARRGTSTSDPAMLVEIDELDGRIAARCGPVMRGHAILIAAAERADPERAIAMLAEAAFACLYAGEASGDACGRIASKRALPAAASVRARFLAAMTIGMAQDHGWRRGRGRAGSPRGGSDCRELSRPAGRSSAAALADPRAALPAADRGRQAAARTRPADSAGAAAVGALPSLLNLIARDQAATDSWAIAARHLSGSDRPGPRERTADRAVVRPCRTRLAPGAPGAGSRMPGLRRRGAQPEPRARDGAERDMGDVSAR